MLLERQAANYEQHERRWESGAHPDNIDGIGGDSLSRAEPQTGEEASQGRREARTPSAQQRHYDTTALLGSLSAGTLVAEKML